MDAQHPLYIPREHPFRRHSENLQAVRQGLRQAERLHKHAIWEGDEPQTRFMARVHQLMVALVAEAWLRKIITDPNGFNDKELTLLWQERSQLDRWTRAVEFAFRRHYSIPLHLEITTLTANAGAASQFDVLTDLLRNHLAEVVADRNDLAHAQWVWLLNSRGDAFTGAAPLPSNFSALRAQSEIMRNIAALINDLVTSEATFQRDFFKHYNRIKDLRDNLDGSEYPEFVERLGSGKLRGLQWPTRAN